jgi:hypothetical protein
VDLDERGGCGRDVGRCALADDDGVGVGHGCYSIGVS